MDGDILIQSAIVLLSVLAGFGMGRASEDDK